MQVEIKIIETTEDEAAGMELYLAEAKAVAPAGSPIHGRQSMQEVWGAQIAAEVKGYAERVRRARIEAQSELGAVFVQLPEGDQAELTREVLKRAQANRIDVSGLV